MYRTNFYPDGWTERDIDALLDESYDTIELLLAETFESVDETVAAEPASRLVDACAAHRWARRIERQAVNGTVRTFPARRVSPVDGPDSGEAA
jgi:hypothetical protein